MTVDDFTSEMLEELKSAKDLVKGELPELAKEYIQANIAAYGIGVAFGALLILIGIGTAIYGFNHLPINMSDDTCSGAYLVGGLFGVIGIIITSCNALELMNFILQPRRMAIKAITSLK